MADYNSAYTGAEIDTNIGKVANADSAPTSGSTDMITSGAVYTANQAALTAAAAAQSTADAALPKAGGTLTGNIDINDNSVLNASQITMSTGGRITNLSTANDVQTGYAANVAYVLAKISASFAQFAAAVLAVVLSGLSTATATAIEATDTIIVALGKLQAQITATASTVSSLSSTVSTNTGNIATNAGNISTLDSTKADVDDPTFTTKISTPIVQASTSAGVSITNNSGTEVALLGAGGGTGVTLAGQLNGNAIKGYRPTSEQTGTTYTFALGDANTLIYANNGSAQTYTIPANASVGLSIGSEIEVFNLGAGIVTFAAAGGVTIYSKDSLLSMSAQYAAAILKKQDDDTWILIGDLA